MNNIVNKKMNKWLKAVLIIFIVALVSFHVLPYLLPVTKAEELPPQPFPESSYIEVDGVTLHYRLWQPEPENYNGKNVMFVHGLAGSTFSWREQFVPLYEIGYQVVAVDLPGFGYSDRQLGLNHAQSERARCLWELLSQLEGIDNDKYNVRAGELAAWHLVGHSMGGGTITAMAELKPELVDSLIYVGPALFTGGGGGHGAFMFKYPVVGRWLEVIGRNVLLKPERIEQFLTSAYGRSPSEQEVAGYFQPLALAGTERSFLDIVQSSSGVEEATLANFNNYDFPILAIWGEQDSWVDVSDAEQLLELVPRTQLVTLQTAAHCPMETHAHEFNDIIILNWLK